jgi:hypothetical protein
MARQHPSLLSVLIRLPSRFSILCHRPSLRVGILALQLFMNTYILQRDGAFIQSKNDWTKKAGFGRRILCAGFGGPDRPRYFWTAKPGRVSCVKLCREHFFLCSISQSFLDGHQKLRKVFAIVLLHHFTFAICNCQTLTAFHFLGLDGSRVSL